MFCISNADIEKNNEEKLSKTSKFKTKNSLLTQQALNFRHSSFSKYSLINQRVKIWHPERKCLCPPSPKLSTLKVDLLFLNSLRWSRIPIPTVACDVVNSDWLISTHISQLELLGLRDKEE